MLHVRKSTPIHSSLLTVDFLKQGMLQCLCFIYNNGYKLISSLECIYGLFLSISATVFITTQWNLCSMRLYLVAVTHSYEQWKETIPSAEKQEWKWHSIPHLRSTTFRNVSQATSNKIPSCNVSASGRQFYRFFCLKRICCIKAHSF